MAKESKSVPFFRCYASPPRTEMSARGDALFQDPDTVCRGFGQIDDATLFVCVWPPVCDLDFDLFPGGAIFDHDFGT